MLKSYSISGYFILAVVCSPKFFRIFFHFSGGQTATEDIFRSSFSSKCCHDWHPDFPSVRSFLPICAAGPSVFPRPANLPQRFQPEGIVPGTEAVLFFFFQASFKCVKEYSFLLFPQSQGYVSHALALYSKFLSGSSFSLRSRIVF